MKKIVFLFTIVCLLGSCVAASEGDVQESEYSSLYINDGKDDVTRVVNALPFDYAGHSYIYFNAPNGDGQILHDPDCKKCERQ